MPQRFKSLSISVFLLLCGTGLWAMTNWSSFRFPKAEAAGYLFMVVGGIATIATGIRAARYVRPSVGCRVHFWGPDGRSKLVGRIASADGDRFAVETDAGLVTLREADFLRIERPAA